MDLIGYFASILIGISLGLIGSGGSILTVPVLVYLFHIDVITATTYSLFIVGLSSAAGTFPYFRGNMMDIKTALIFGIPSVLAVFFSRRVIVPAIPESVFEIGNLAVTRSTLLLSIFAVLMVIASYSMIAKSEEADQPKVNRQKPFSNLRILSLGALVGLVTGLVGAGGGFLIVPALIGFLKTPIKTAIGTSLLIVAINSLTGFLFSVTFIAINWCFLLSVTLMAFLGIFVGSKLAKKIEGRRLRFAFGWFVLIMGIYILLRELLFK